METQQNQVALPMRPHTILGVCEAIGEDFGFNPMYLRIPFAAGVLWNPMMMIALYLGLGAIVLVSRLLFPRAKPVETPAQAPVLSAANEQSELANAA